MSTRRSTRVTAKVKAAKTAETIRTAQFSDDSSGDDDSDDALAPVLFSKKTRAPSKAKDASVNPFLAMLAKKKEAEKQIQEIREEHAEAVRQDEAILQELRGGLGETNGTDTTQANGVEATALPGNPNGVHANRFGDAATSGPAKLDDGHCRVLFLRHTSLGSSSTSSNNKNNSRKATPPSSRKAKSKSGGGDTVPAIPAPPTCKDVTSPSAKLYEFLTRAFVDRNPDALATVLADRIIPEFIRLSPKVHECPADIARWLFDVATTRTGLLPCATGAMYSFAGLLRSPNAGYASIHDALYGTPEAGPLLVGGVERLSLSSDVVAGGKTQVEDSPQQQPRTAWMPSAGDWCRVLENLGVKLDKAEAETALKVEREGGGSLVEDVCTKEEPTVATLDLTVRFLTYCAVAMKAEASPHCSELVAMLILLLADNSATEVEVSVRAALNAVLYSVVPKDDLSKVVTDAVAKVAARAGVTPVSQPAPGDTTVKPLLAGSNIHSVACLMRVCRKLPPSHRGSQVGREVVNCILDSYFQPAAAAGGPEEFARTNKLLSMLVQDVKLSVRRSRKSVSQAALRQETAGWYFVLCVVDHGFRQLSLGSRQRQLLSDVVGADNSSGNVVWSQQDADNANKVVEGMKTISGVLNSRMDDMSGRLLDYVQLLQQTYLQQSATSQAVMQSASTLGNKTAKGKLTISSFFTKHPAVPAGAEK